MNLCFSTRYQHMGDFSRPNFLKLCSASIQLKMCKKLNAVIKRVLFDYLENYCIWLSKKINKFCTEAGLPILA